MDQQLMALESSGTLVEKVTYGIDSCAAVTISKPDVAADYPLRKDTRNTYRTANGSTVTDDGSRHIFVKNGGHALGCLRTRVGQVSRNLMAVVDLVDTGHRVVFERDGDRDVSRATHKATGRSFPLRRAKRIYEADFEVQPFSRSPSGASSSTK